MEIVYRNNSRSSKNKPFLFFASKGKLHLFSGRAIPGVVSVKDRQYWDSGVATYTLQTHDSVRAFSGTQRDPDCICSGLVESLNKLFLTLKDYSTSFGVSEEEVMRFMKTHWPRSAEKIEANDSSLKSLFR